jgi:stress-induced-phosphoprotein 1
MAAEKKALGNAAFQTKQYEEALACYSEAIVMDPTNHIIFANRSACLGAVGNWRQAADDAAECVKLDGCYIKGYFRLASAQIALNQPKDAEATARKGLAHDAKNTGLVQLVRKSRQLAKDLKEEARVQKQREIIAAKCAEMSPEERKWKVAPQPLRLF